MNHLRQIAIALHAKETEQEKLVVREIFKGMNPNSNGGVRYQEFSAYMKTLGTHENLSSKEFFDEVKQFGKEELYFEDIITVRYIIQSQRPFCGGNCKKFIEGSTYLICVKCFMDVDRGHNGPTFSVCSHCFVAENFKHEHREFKDASALLTGYKGMKP